MNSAIYEGRVLHARRAPKRHQFEYSIFQMYLDLSELDTVFRGRWLWSTDDPALAWFRRKDHFGDPKQPLQDCVRALVEAETGVRPDGPIRLLTHLRYFGYVMNPVSFYYCFDEDGERVDAIVAEVRNTPWGETHCYVVHGPFEDEHTQAFEFEKAFHVSPFMPMEQKYRWAFTAPGQSLRIAMASQEDGKTVFTAAIAMSRREIGRRSLARVLVAYPAMTMKVIGAIYWQALRLWLKGVPFHSHPKHEATREVEAHE